MSRYYSELVRKYYSEEPVNFYFHETDSSGLRHRISGDCGVHGAWKSLDEIALLVDENRIYIAMADEHTLVGDGTIHPGVVHRLMALKHKEKAP